ncbi:MAG: hypothetical protein QM755_19150 [Luteolibacter sp.]
MAERLESSTRRWSGYVCPDCRFVFRVPRDHDGNGLVCPSCRRMLRLPVAGEVLPPLVAPAGEETSAAASNEPSPASGGHGSRRRRDQPEWEEKGGKASSNSDRLVIGGVALALLAITAGAFLLMRGKPPAAPTVREETTVASALPGPVETAPKPPSSTAEEVANDPKVIMEESERMAKAFLHAKQIQEVLPLIAHPETSGPRLKRKWPDDRIVPEGLSVFAGDGGFSISGNVLAVNVQTGDFKNRVMFFQKTDQGWKIDWESWVDWSGMTWEEFLSKKPVTPTPFRVLVTESSYYNFGFTDEKKWRSVRLQSVDGEHQLDGYIDRDSEIFRQLNFDTNTPSFRCMMELSFPEGGHANQVIVGKMVSPSWVAPETKDKP